MTTERDRPEVSVERKDKCREFLLYMEREGNLAEQEYASDLIAILTEHAKVKAENEWMSGELEATRKISTMADAEAWKARAEKAEAELRELRAVVPDYDDYESTAEWLDELKRRALKYTAALAAKAPK